jgi:hypothetical protein
MNGPEIYYGLGKQGLKYFGPGCKRVKLGSSAASTYTHTQRSWLIPFANCSHTSFAQFHYHGRSRASNSTNDKWIACEAASSRFLVVRSAKCWPLAPIEQAMLERVILASTNVRGRPCINVSYYGFFFLFFSFLFFI